MSFILKKKHERNLSAVVAALKLMIRHKGALGLAGS
jgi:hypothetical protein